MARLPAPSKRVCVALGCDTRMPAGARSDKIYCSKRCSRRMAQARLRRQARIDSGTPPTRADLELSYLEAQEQMAIEALTHAALNRAAPAPPAAPPDPLGAQYTPLPAPPAPAPTSLGGRGLKPTSLVPTSPTTGQIDRAKNAARRGPVYEALIEEGYARQIDLGHMTKSDAARLLKISPSAVSRAMDAYAVDQRQQSIDDDHSLTPAQRTLLTDYTDFATAFFPEDDIPDFHLEWEQALTHAIDTGHRQLLMAPQRHGKTTFLLRTILRRIIENPDLCVLWVGKTAALASQMTGYLRQILEHDKRLTHEFLPEGQSFMPGARSGLPWRNDEFTLNTRTSIRKSATVTAIGAGGTILGRDADIIIIDDPVDRAMCLSTTERTKVEEWFFTDFISRKMEHTGVVYIGSRQHHQDLPAEIIRRNNEAISNGFEADWSVDIYRAHSPKCPVIADTPAATVGASSLTLDDPDKYLDHDAAGCVLWPKFRSFAWLMGQRRANPEHFERNYQNNPSSDAMIAVKEADITASFELDKWFSTARRSPKYPSVWQMDGPRVFGQVPPGTRLVASIDPASAKPNAAVLWAYTNTPHPIPDLDDPSKPPVLAPTRAIVDIRETPRPGSPGILRLIEDWFATYRVVEWVFETNIYKDQVKNDTDLADIRARHGLRYHTHHTSASTKHDPVAGISAMLAQMRKRPSGVLLPGGDDLSKRKVNRLVQQMLNFDPEVSGGGSRKNKADDDLVMAMWIGWYWLERNARVQSQTIRYSYPEAYTSTSSGRVAGLGWSQPPKNWSAA